MSKGFTLYKGSNVCPSCNSSDGRCKSDGILILCMSDAINPPQGYRFTKRSKDGIWAIFAPGDDNADAQTRETWRLQQEALKRKREQEEKAKRDKSLSSKMRDYLNRKLIAELHSINGLHPADRADLQRRGITDEQIEEWGVVSVVRGQRLNEAYPAQLAGIKPGFGRSLQVAGDGYLCPAYSIDGLLLGFQLRIRGASDNKYRWLSIDQAIRLPNGENPIAIFGDRTSNRAYLVEGIGAKPFIASKQLDGLVIGAAGGQFAASPEQLKGACEGRSPVLVPDSAAVLNRTIMRQYQRLAALLPNLQVLWWEQIAKGADVDEVEPSTLDSAQLLPWAEFEAIALQHGGIEPEQPKKIISIEAGKGALLQRKPDLEIGEDEFKDHVSEFPTTGIVALWGAQGSGKGEAIAQMLGGRTWLSYTTLRSLARDQKEGWGGVFISDGDIANGQLLDGNGQPVRGGSICIHSALKTRGIKPKVLVLDEWPALCDALSASNLCNKDGIRALLIEELAAKARQADLVIMASADLREEGLRWLEDTRGDRTYLIQSKRLPLRWEGRLIDAKQDRAIAELLHHAANMPKDKMLVIHADSKAMADQISALLLEQGRKNLLITSDTSGGDIESSFLSSKGADLPQLAMMGIRAIVTSPSVKEGFSIKYNADLIDSVWGFFEGCSITADAVAQTLNRVRSLAPRYLWIREKGRAYSKLSHAETIAGFLRDLKKCSSIKVELVKRSLKTETLSAIEGIDWHSNNLRLLADGEVRRNKGMKAFRASVLEALVREGKIITEHQLQVNEGDALEVTEKREAIRSRLELEYANALTASPSYTDAQVDELEKLEKISPLTPEQRMGIERYYLERFYLRTLDRDLALWDKKGARRQEIRNLEMVLNPEKAEKDAAFSIEQNTSTPQDWKRSRLQLEAMERSGMAGLVRRIVDGEVTELDPVEVKAIGSYFEAHPEEFEMAFNFKNAHLVSAMQLVAHCFDWCGIKRTSEQRRIEGKRTRIYSVDADHLQNLKTIIERRSQAVTPPFTGNEIGGGVTPEIAPADTGWNDPAAIAEAREMLALATNPEVRAYLMSQIPNHLWEAIAS